MLTEYYQRALNLILENKFKAAVEYFQIELRLGDRENIAAYIFLDYLSSDNLFSCRISQDVWFKGQEFIFLNHGVIESFPSDPIHNFLKGYYYQSFVSSSKPDMAILAFQLYSLSALQNYPLAQYQLGVCYEQGLGVFQDSSKATQSYITAASNQFAPAQFKLGLSYQEGKGVGINAELAYQYFQQAASSGYAPARYKIGLALYTRDRNSDITLAQNYFRLAAEAGYADAQYALAVCLEKQNMQQTIYWYKQAAEQNHLNAAYKLAKLFSSSKRRELNNFEEAKKWCNFIIAYDFPYTDLKVKAHRILSKICTG